MTDYNNLDELIEDIEEKCRARDLSDAYLSQCGASTREDMGIGEYFYGITMVPASWILPYLKQLQDILGEKNERKI